MRRMWYLIAAGVIIWVGIALFAWALCRMAALSDERARRQLKDRER